MVVVVAVVGGMCEEMGKEGEVESMPEVVYGVRSSTSGKCTRAVFLEAYAPKWTERLRCNASTGGGWLRKLDTEQEEERKKNDSPARPWPASSTPGRTPSPS